MLEQNSERFISAATCHGCGYDLRGLPRSGVCPECERPIVESLGRMLGQLGRVPLLWLGAGLIGDMLELVALVAPLAAWFASIEYLFPRLNDMALLRVGVIILACGFVVQGVAYVGAVHALRVKSVRSDLQPMRERMLRRMMLYGVLVAVGALALVTVVTFASELPTVAVVILWMAVALVVLRHRPAMRAFEIARPFDSFGDSVTVDDGHRLKFAGELLVGVPILTVFLSSMLLESGGMACCGLAVSYVWGLTWLIISIGQFVSATQLLGRIRRFLPIASSSA